jgi:hypothetical protein
MIVGRNWKGKGPAGIIAVVYSPTDLVFAIPRIQISAAQGHSPLMDSSASASTPRPGVKTD